MWSTLYNVDHRPTSKQKKKKKTKTFSDCLQNENPRIIIKITSYTHFNLQRMDLCRYLNNQRRHQQKVQGSAAAVGEHGQILRLTNVLLTEKLKFAYNMAMQCSGRSYVFCTHRGND
jgi:hypothetical protein